MRQETAGVSPRLEPRSCTPNKNLTQIKQQSEKRPSDSIYPKAAFHENNFAKVNKLTWTWPDLWTEKAGLVKTVYF